MSPGENGREAFQYTALPARVLFGFGTIAKVADELVALGRKRAFVLSDPHHATAAAARLMLALGEFGIQLSTDAVMHTPVEVTERVMEKLAACNADCIVALGDLHRRMHDGIRRKVDTEFAEGTHETRRGSRRMMRIGENESPLAT